MAGSTSSFRLSHRDCWWENNNCLGVLCVGGGGSSLYWYSQAPVTGRSMIITRSRMCISAHAHAHKQTSGYIHDHVDVYAIVLCVALGGRSHKLGTNSFKMLSGQFSAKNVFKCTLALHM